MTKEKFYELLANPEKHSHNTIEGLNELTNEYPFFQAAWFLYLNNLKITENKEYKSVLKMGALQVPDRKRLYNLLNKKITIFSEEKIFEQPKHNFFKNDLDDVETDEQSDSLIDKFLSSNTSTIRIKSETAEEYNHDSENDVFEQSNYEDDEIITETLAMIYFEQKKYDKAMAAFKKLSLKYPEKSIYFATRIAEIEQLKNI